MNILLISGDNTLTNSGDNAMLIVSAKRFQELIPGTKISVVTRAPGRLNSVLPGAKPVVVGTPINLPTRLLELLRYIPGLGNWLRERRYLTWAEQVLPAVSMANAVILSGQGVMTDAFSHEAIWRLEILEAAHLQGKLTALFSQGLGIITNPELASVMGRVLPKMDLITLRSEMHMTALRSTYGCALDTIRDGADDGLAYPNVGAVAARAQAIGVSLRVNDYAGVRELSDPRWLSLSRVLRSIVSELGASILPVPVHPGDQSAIEASFGLSPESLEQPGLSELIEKIARCRLVVTGSYHSAVFALAMGIPALCLTFSDYYAVKFEGLKRQFGDGCLEFDVRKSNPEDLAVKVQALWDQAERMSPRLLSISEQLIERNRAHYMEFAQLLRDRD